MGGAALRTSTFPRSFARQSFAEDFRRAMAATRVRPCAREIFTTLEYGPVPESHACALVRACPAAAVYSLAQAHGPHLARGLPSSSATFSEAPPPPRVIPAAGLVDGLACRMPPWRFLRTRQGGVVSRARYLARSSRGLTPSLTVVPWRLTGTLRTPSSSELPLNACLYQNILMLLP